MMTATIQFTMEFEAKNNTLLVDDFLYDLDCLLMRRYDGKTKFFKDQIAINRGTRIIKLTDNNPDF